MLIIIDALQIPGANELPSSESNAVTKFHQIPLVESASFPLPYSYYVGYSTTRSLLFDNDLSARLGLLAPIQKNGIAHVNN